jgi:hypothetical protein
VSKSEPDIYVVEVVDPRGWDEDAPTVGRARFVSALSKAKAEKYVTSTFTVRRATREDMISLHKAGGRIEETEAPPPPGPQADLLEAPAAAPEAPLGGLSPAMYEEMQALIQQFRGAIEILNTSAFPPDSEVIQRHINDLQGMSIDNFPEDVRIKLAEMKSSALAEMQLMHNTALREEADMQKDPVMPPEPELVAPDAAAVGPAPAEAIAETIPEF